MKASVYETDDGNGCVILINSAAEPAEGRVRLNASYAACSEELGAPHASLADNALRFRLAPHESAVVPAAREALIPSPENTHPGRILLHDVHTGCDSFHRQ